MSCDIGVDESFLDLADDLHLACPKQDLSCDKTGSWGGRGEGVLWDTRKPWNRAVLKVDVNCTPISALDKLLKQLEGPGIPTFKLSNLPQSVRDDLQSIASPSFDETKKCFHSGPMIASEGAGCPFSEGLRPAVDKLRGLDSRAQSMPLPECQADMPHAIIADSAPSMPLPDMGLAGGQSEMPSTSQESLGSCEALGQMDLGAGLGFPAGHSFSPALTSSPVLADQEATDKCNNNAARGIELPKAGTTRQKCYSIVGGAKGRQISCLQCGTMVTPQWRSGPDGPRTMCNACGVKYRKELRDRERQGDKRRRLES